MTNEIIQAEVIQPKQKNKLSRGQMIDLAILSPVVIFLMFAGLCKAYDMAMQHYLEDSLSKNITAVQSTGQACEASYQALLKYKQDNNIKVNGTDDPCSVF